MEDYHRFLLSMQLRRVEDTEQYIEQLDQRIAEKLEPYQSAMALLMQIPGVDWVVAAVLIAEIGTDMSVFISVYHLAAWSGLCPGSHESAGKRRNVSVRKGNMHLRTILVGAARAAAVPKAATSRTTSTASKRGAAPSVPKVPSRIRSWWPPTTCCPAASAIASWARPTWIRSTRPDRRQPQAAAGASRLRRLDPP